MPFPLYVLLLTGNALTLQVEGTETVEELKEKIAQRSGVPVRYQPAAVLLVVSV